MVVIASSLQIFYAERYGFCLAVTVSFDPNQR